MLWGGNTWCFVLPQGNVAKLLMIARKEIDVIMVRIYMARRLCRTLAVPTAAQKETPTEQGEPASFYLKQRRLKACLLLK
mmetsp:Transcript_13744/g.24863  ORF Transcript_13744/g.24863 Transcript_13744/m.24863 type:complete len:80 (-) Transcript_13744:424-663(-)